MESAKKLNKIKEYVTEDKGRITGKTKQKNQQFAREKVYFYFIRYRFSKNHAALIK